MTPKQFYVQISQSRNFLIDLTMVRDNDRVVSILGSMGPQVVPGIGAVVTAEDEDGNVYDAWVETILPDRRVYLRVVWASRRRSHPLVTAYRPPAVWTLVGGN